MIFLGRRKNAAYTPRATMLKGNSKGSKCIYRGADKSLARPTSRCILFDGENISFDASLVYIYIYIYIYIHIHIHTGYTQKNGAVSKVTKKFISHLTWAQRTPPAAATVQVSHALITILQCVHHGSHDTHPHGNQNSMLSSDTRGRPGLPLHKHPVSTNCRYHLVMLFLCGASFLNRAWNSRCTVITDLDTSKPSTKKAFSCCDAILETDPAISIRSELLVAHEKLGQLPLLTVYVVPV